MSADKVRALAREVLRLDGEATPEPWEQGSAVFRDSDGDVHTQPDPNGDMVIGVADLGFDSERAAQDARLIAHYRTAAPALARSLLAGDAQLLALLESDRLSPTYQAVGEIIADALDGAERHGRDPQHPRPSIFKTTDAICATLRRALGGDAVREAAQRYVTALEARIAAGRDRARVEAQTFKGRRVPRRIPRNAIFLEEMPPEERAAFEARLAEEMAPLTAAMDIDAKARADEAAALAALRRALAGEPATQQREEVRAPAAPRVATRKGLRPTLRDCGEFEFEPEPPAAVLSPEERAEVEEIRGRLTTRRALDIDAPNDDVADLIRLIDRLTSPAQPTPTEEP